MVRESAKPQLTIITVLLLLSRFMRPEEIFLQRIYVKYICNKVVVYTTQTYLFIGCFSCLKAYAHTPITVLACTYVLIGILLNKAPQPTRYSIR